MKTIGRTLTFFVFAVITAIIVYFHYGTPPISAIPSRSMVPTFHVGDLVLIEPVDPREVQIGDIIVVDVPKAVQQHFGYPPNIIHRVVEKKKVGSGYQFRVKGDNNKEQDPFTILPDYIMGKAGPSYSNLGYAILFLNSKQGFYFIIASLALYLVFMISDELKKRKISLRRGIASFFFSEVFHQTREIEQGQQAILDLLKKKDTGAEDDFLPSDFDSSERLARIRKQIVQQRLWIEQMHGDSDGDGAYEEVLELFNVLEDKIGEISGALDPIPSDFDGELRDAEKNGQVLELETEPEPEGTGQDQVTERQELPPRSETKKKKRRFF